MRGDISTVELPQCGMVVTHSLACALSALPRLRLSGADFPKLTSQLLEWLLGSQSHPRQARTANEWTGTRMPVRSPFCSRSAVILIQVVSSTVPINHESSLRRRTHHLEHHPHSLSHLRDLPRSMGRIFLGILSLQKRPPRFARPFWSCARDD